MRIFEKTRKLPQRREIRPRTPDSLRQLGALPPDPPRCYFCLQWVLD